MKGGCDVASEKSWAAASSTTLCCWIGMTDSIPCVFDPSRAGCRDGTSYLFVWRSREAGNEGQRGVGDLAPPTVDRERVSAARDLDEFGDAGVVLLAFERGRGD